MLYLLGITWKFQDENFGIFKKSLRSFEAKKNQLAKRFKISDFSKKKIYGTYEYKEIKKIKFWKKLKYLTTS